MLLTIKPHFIRPRVTVRAKKNDFIEPAEAPGEGRRRSPNIDDFKWDNEELGSREKKNYNTWDEKDIEHWEKLSKETKKKAVHPIKELISKFFKIKEIDYEKFKKESMWAIRIDKEDKE